MPRPRCRKMPSMLARSKQWPVPGKSTYKTQGRGTGLCQKKSIHYNQTVSEGVNGKQSLSSPKVQQQSRHGTVCPPQTWAEASSFLSFALPHSRTLHPSAGASLRAWKAITGLWRKWWWVPQHKTMSPARHELAGHKSCLALSPPPFCHLLQTLGF